MSFDRGRVERQHNAVFARLGQRFEDCAPSSSLAYSTTERWSLARGTIRFAFRSSLLVTMMIAICGITIVLSLARNLQHELTISLAIGLATVPLVAMGPPALARSD